ncbi:MAG: GDCCVxC domain-containing (seleno)protein [Thiobacillaceae bacterium]
MGCHNLLKSLPGHCCVFCSYGDVPCPPIQIEGGCCNPESAGGKR